MEFDDWCASSYLTFRYVAEAGRCWAPEICPSPTIEQSHATTPVATARQIRSALSEAIQRCRPDSGLLLSGGIDSAILAALMPRGTRCYTIRYETGDAVDEVERARAIADRWGHDHQVISISWDHYLDCLGLLFERKQSPLHALEPALHVAARRAVDDGLSGLVTGTGADVIFGGMDKLLSSSWEFGKFVSRYTFCDPNLALNRPQRVSGPFEKFRIENDRIDVHHFLQHVHGGGISDAFDNALRAAECAFIAPYESISMLAELDIDRITAGDPKYLLQEVYRELYGTKPPTKIAFSRPMDDWFDSWTGPVRAEFKTDLSIAGFGGEARWLLWCLERFMNHFELERTGPK